MIKPIAFVAIFLFAGINAKNCLDRLKELKASQPLVGAFVPICRPDGKYEDTQCHGSTGYCFCVNPETGEKLLGTELRFKKPQSCKMTDCITKRHEALKANLRGSFRPVCNEDGSYNATQCHGSTGFCFCVNPKDGQKLLGTELRFQRPETCEMTKCIKDQHKALKENLMGSFRPKCEKDGSFKDIQCHGSTGYCFCVNTQTGERLLGSELRFQRPKLCKCFKEHHEATKANLLGSFRPKCQKDGSYNITQCHAGFCYCVVPETGEEILGTRLTVRGQRPTSCQQTECFKERHQAIKTNLLGSFRPKCQQDGSYSTTQCHAGFCYCVFPDTGKEILGTRMTVRGQRPTSCKQTACVIERHDSLSKGLVGSRTPQCDVSGKYSKIQCHGSTGMCWCVDTDTGKTLVGSNPQRSPVKCD